MAWNLDDYEPVESRLSRFIAEMPDFRIETELLAHEGNRFIVLARLYRTYADSAPFATGLACEVVSDRGVNSTSALENAETSAIGRALANAGYAAKGKRPSREEMAKVKSFDSPLVVRPFKGEDKPVPNEPETIVWEENTTTAATDNGAFMQTLVDKLGAEPVSYTCQHGERVFKTGQSKTTGKLWAMWGCIEKLKGAQCEPLWGKLSDGKWLFELKAVNHG